MRVSPQRLSRLTPLAAVAAALSRWAPVSPQTVPVGAALGAVLAADVAASAPTPATGVALRDGWAVAADQTLDAGAYSPVVPAGPFAWVEAGAPLPPGADAVAPPDSIIEQSGRKTIVAPAAPGDGVVPRAFDAAAGHILAGAGKILRPPDLLALATCGVAAVAVRRPRVLVVPVGALHAATAGALAAMIDASGGAGEIAAGDFVTASATAADAIFTIGGTGEGERDETVETLARVGELIVHGFAVRPGESAALGAYRGRPVLALPGRFDAALSVWLVVGRMLLAQLSGAAAAPPLRQAPLTRKVTSTVGLTEAFLVRVGPDGAEPLASGLFPAAALAAATGWALVPPESEGYAKGAVVDVYSL